MTSDSLYYGGHSKLSGSHIMKSLNIIAIPWTMKIFYQFFSINNVYFSILTDFMLVNSHISPHLV